MLAEKPIRHRYCIDLFREMAPHLHKSDDVWHMRTKIWMLEGSEDVLDVST